MKLKRADFLFFLGLFLPALFAFKSFFLPGPLAWGDAPFFYPEGLRELISEPYAWTGRGQNFGGLQPNLWLYPLMLVYGFLHTAFGLSNDAIVRLLFYFPAVFLSFATPIVFARYLGYKKVVGFFSSLVFGLNTYFLLLVDGGQVGVALAYGLFPLTLLFLHKLTTKPGVTNFFTALGVLLLLSVADVRIAAVSLFTLVLWVLVEWLATHKANIVRNLRFLIPLGVATVGLSSYWLLPTLKLAGGLTSLDVSRLKLVSLLNPLFLFQPHWPENIFGQVSPPPFYFVGIPFLLFACLLFKKNKKAPAFALLFLLFSFLAKGETPPLGEFYNWAVDNLPFGFAFRDSTKFFVPLLLFAGILVGTTVEAISRRRMVLVLGVYAYLLFLIHPVLLGDLNFVLSNRTGNGDLTAIYKNLKKEERFFRTAWFPERHPLAFQTEEKPALDAKKLVEERPFAAINAGSFDLFNFLHNEQFLEWFDLLGIRYLVLSGDPRKITLNEEEGELWGDLQQRVATASGLTKVDWGTSFPVYKVSETKPRLFAQERLIAVVGGDQIYKEFAGELAIQPFVFFEDGRLDPRDLEGIASESAVLVFDQKDEKDLTLSFLQEYFAGVGKAKNSSWAFYTPEEYLIWKYQLLIRGIETSEFDYNRGLAFSSQAGEKLAFNLEVEKKGEYMLAVRSMFGPQANPLKLELNGVDEVIEPGEPDLFSWFVKPLSLEKGKYSLVLQNTGGLQVLNVVALIPQESWREAQQLASNFVGHFDVVETGELVRLVGQSSWQELDFEKLSPVRYRITAPERANWIVFTDSYHPKWKLKEGTLLHNSLPFYSAVNGFYVKPSWTRTEIVFEGQKEVRWGLYFSIVSLLSLAVVFLWVYPERVK